MWSQAINKKLRQSPIVEKTIRAAEGYILPKNTLA